MSSEALAVGMSGRSIVKWGIASVTLRMTLVVKLRALRARHDPVLIVALTAGLVPRRITRHGEGRMPCRIVGRVTACLAGVPRVGR